MSYEKGVRNRDVKWLYITNRAPKFLDQPFNKDMQEDVFYYAYNRDDNAKLKCYHTYIGVVSKKAYEFCREYLVYRFGDPKIDDLRFTEEERLYFIWTIDEDYKPDHVIYKKAVTDDGRPDCYLLARRLCNSLYVLLNMRNLSSNKKEKDSGA